MEQLPTIGFGPIRITRLVSGGNPLVGYSHFSAGMDGDMSSYFTEEEVVRYLHRIQQSGINTLQARRDYHRILHWRELFKRGGGRLHWIAQTASEMSDVFENIRVLAAAGADAIYHHGTQTDNWWLDGSIDRVRDYLTCMRDRGVRVGLATHIPEVIEYVEEKAWDVDFYMACFYNLNRRPRQSAVVAQGSSTREEFDPDDPAAMCRVIRATRKTCLAFKILGASRQCSSQEQVREAFRFAFSSIKPIDAVVVGMFPRHVDHINLNVQHTLEACQIFQGKGRA
jgi:hypothetical protein